MADVTTMKISTSTRDRLRSLRADGDSLEDVVIAALDVYEADQFWAQAEAAVSGESDERRSLRRQTEADIDAWMQRLR